MKKLLILGASELQVPAIKKAKELGHYVIVADYNDKAVGINNADEYHNVSTINIEKIVELSKNIMPDGIMTLATDMPMRAIAKATEELNLPGISFQTAIKTTDKGEMIKALSNNKVPTPHYIIVDNINDLDVTQLLFPFVIKPVDNSGSRGVQLINDEKELYSLFEYSQKYSRSGEVLIEEYMIGKEISVEMMVIDNVPYVLAITDKVTTQSPYFVELSHSQPSLLKESDLLKVKDVAKAATSAVGINTGPAHVEIMVTNEGPKVIELGARLAGDSIATHLVPLSTGIDYVKATIQSSLGEQIDIRPKFKKASAIQYFYTKPGIISSINGLEKIKNSTKVKKLVFDKQEGEKIVEIKSSTDRIGYFIVQGNTINSVKKVCDKLTNEINIEVM